MFRPYLVKCFTCDVVTFRPDRNIYRCGVCRKVHYPINFLRARKEITPTTRCSVCGMTNKRSIYLFNRSLCLHHIDGDISNNKRKNLVFKCIQCHFGEHRTESKTVSILHGIFGNRRIYKTGGGKA